MILSDCDAAYGLWDNGKGEFDYDKETQALNA